MGGHDEAPAEHEFGITETEQAELDNLFSYHAPHGDQVDRYGVIRVQARQLARVIMAYSVDSEERRQALFAVRAAVMWANAGIACNEPPPDDTMPAAWVGGIR